MASYNSYKRDRLSGSNFVNGAIQPDDLAQDVRNTYSVKWIYGDLSRCTPGCCCLWTVPNNVKRLKFELWGSGGNGAGACSCNRCQHWRGAGGGTYNTRSITTNPGCQYQVCAAGVVRCLTREASGAAGCPSYVNGYNLSDFCADGGGPGVSNTSWATACYSVMQCCKQPGNNGGEFATFNHVGPWSGTVYQYPGGTCHCWKQLTFSTGGAMMDTGRNDQFFNFCWIRCGFACVPFAAGGQNGITNYCGSSCCGRGGTGGSGVVKITYY